MSTSWCLRKVGPNPRFNRSNSPLLSQVFVSGGAAGGKGIELPGVTEAGSAVRPPQPPRPPPPPPECGLTALTLTALTLTAQLLCGDAIHTSALSATCSRQRSARSRGHPRTLSSPEPPVTPQGSPVPISSHCPHPPPPLIPTRSLPAPADAPVLDTSRPRGHVPCGRVCARRPSSRGPCRCLPPSVAAGHPPGGWAQGTYVCTRQRTSLVPTLGLL